MVLSTCGPVANPEGSGTDRQNLLASVWNRDRGSVLHLLLFRYNLKVQVHLLKWLRYINTYIMLISKLYTILEVNLS